MDNSHQVTFCTNFFRPVVGEDDETNLGRYGKELALWLARQLTSRGVPMEGIIPKDFGWLVMISRKPYRLGFGCGNTDGSTTEWTIFTVCEASTLQGLCKRRNQAATVEMLKADLTEIVPLVPEVTNIVWR